jgi:pimeloyl-ACP methyl ester carboxylesterase
LETPFTNPQKTPQSIGPIIDEVPFSSLYHLEEYEVPTPDGWTLKVTRYKPVPQNWHQPLLNIPLLLVHGFGQNRHAWTTGEFVKDMLYFGTDIHIVELRGHGKSSIAFQKEKSRKEKVPLPKNYAYGWDFDDYLAYDLPSTIEKVKEISGHSKIAYCGHSLGGIMGYALAGLRDDLLCLATIGSPGVLGVESPLFPLLASLEPLIPLGQKTVMGIHTLYTYLKPILEKIPFSPRLPTKLPIHPEVFPLDLLLGGIYQTIIGIHKTVPNLLPPTFRLFNPDKVRVEDIRWLLTVGEEREPIRVLRTIARWVRKKEIKAYRLGLDIQALFPRITIPLTIIFGDQDIFAGLKSTRIVYEKVKSNYLVWRPVKGNSHIEITMGTDIRQICYDIKNLIEYSITHLNRSPRLPRHLPTSE